MATDLAARGFVMGTVLNEEGFAYARWLIERGYIAEDERDDWNDDAPSEEEVNTFLAKKGFEQFARWHLGIDYAQSEHSKDRFSYLFGDFRSVHRCAVMTLESQALRAGHVSITRAAKELLGLLEA